MLITKVRPFLKVYSEDSLGQQMELLYQVLVVGQVIQI